MNYKIVLIGNKGVGKTTFLKKKLTGEFSKSYIATLGVEVHPLRFNTNYGPLVFNVWDCAGDEKFKGLDDGYYVNANGAILMFDQTSETTTKMVDNLYNKFRRMSNGNIVVCGTKFDVSIPGCIDNICKVVRHLNVKFYGVSSKSNYNIDKPFLELARQISNKPDLCFI